MFPYPQRNLLLVVLILAPTYPISIASVAAESAPGLLGTTALAREGAYLLALTSIGQDPAIVPQPLEGGTVNLDTSASGGVGSGGPNSAVLADIRQKAIEEIDRILTNLDSTWPGVDAVFGTEISARTALDSGEAISGAIESPIVELARQRLKKLTDDLAQKQLELTEANDELVRMNPSNRTELHARVKALRAGITGLNRPIMNARQNVTNEIVRHRRLKSEVDAASRDFASQQAKVDQVSRDLSAAGAGARAESLHRTLLTAEERLQLLQGTVNAKRAALDEAEANARNQLDPIPETSPLPEEPMAPPAPREGAIPLEGGESAPKKGGGPAPQEGTEPAPKKGEAEAREGGEPAPRKVGGAAAKEAGEPTTE